MTTSVRRKIFEIAEELLREGRRPTQQLVRERLGSGSITTINRGLNEWWAALGERLNNATQTTGIPEPVIRLSTRLWSEALGYAREEHNRLRIEQERSLNQIKEQLLRERSEYSDKLLALNERLAQQQGSIADLEQQNQAVKIALQTAEEECYRLTKSKNSRENSNLSGDTDSKLHDQLLENQVALRMKQEMIDNLSNKNQLLIAENAELKLRLKQIQG